MAGVVYAHRNEDVVNFRSGILVEAEPSMPMREDRDHSSSFPVKEVRESLKEYEEMKDDNPQDSDSSKRRKHDQCSLLALFMGMEEVELRKLLSPNEPNPSHQNEDEIPEG